MQKARLLCSLLLVHSSRDTTTTFNSALDSTFHRLPYSIRPVTTTSATEDAPELTRLLKSSVEGLGSSQGYTERQVQAWYDRLLTVPQMTQRLQDSHRRTWVAVSTGTSYDKDKSLPCGAMLGMIQCVLPDPTVSTAATFAYLDLLYVHPLAARQGIGAALVEHMLLSLSSSSVSSTATLTSSRGWWVEASPAARNLLEGLGFVLQTRQRVWLEPLLLPQPGPPRSGGTVPGDATDDHSSLDNRAEDDNDHDRPCLYNYRMVRPPFYASMTNTTTSHQCR